MNALNQFIRYWGDKRFQRHPVITALVPMVSLVAASVALLVPGHWGEAALWIFFVGVAVVYADGILTWRSWRRDRNS